jgi:sterol desaturase/sphingolipid hydroxylase (fatty acid hydroxylase superfamily)
VFRISQDAGWLFSGLFLLFGLFPHMNARIDLGPLTRVILGPQVHRLHHSIDPAHFNTNFAGAFPVWDLAFGTYREPDRGEFPLTGLDAVPSMIGLLGTLFWPVRNENAGQLVRDEPKSECPQAAVSTLVD